MALRTVGVKLTADVSGYVSGMRRATESTKSFGENLNRAASTGQLDAIADRAGVMGLALGGAAVYATKQFMAFDKQMSAVKAATHATAKDMEALRKAAIKAGADTKYSATEAAKGIEELAKAGVSTADILGGGLAGALSLAAAGEIDVGEAAEMAASAMTQFKLKGADLPHVADLLAAGAGKAQGSVKDMGQALNQAGLIAAQTGLSIEDTTGTLAAFANAGLIGSDAGTSFKTMLQALQAPSGVTQKLMDKLGISAYNAQGQFVGITALAQQLRDKLSVLTPELRANAMAQIFGSDATRAASILYEQGAAGVQKWIDAVDDSGYAAETARIKTDNLVGDLERLKGSVESLAIQSGGGANGGLRQLTQVLDELVDNFADLPPVVGHALTILAGVGGVALLAGAGVVKLRRSTADTLQELRETGPAGDKAARGLGKVASAAGKAAGAFVALQLVGAVVNSFQEDLNPQTEAMATGLKDWAEAEGLAGEAARVLGKDMEHLKASFKFLADEDNSRRAAVKNLQGVFESLPLGIDGTNESLAKTKERVEAVDQALATLVTGGRPVEAQKAFERLTHELAVEGVTVDEVKKKFPQYAAALETAGSASAGTTAQTQQLTGAMQESEEQAKETKEAFDSLFKIYMSADEAAIAYKEQLVETNKELREGKRVLDLNSAAGRDNRSTVLDMVEAIKDQREANIASGTAVEDADVKYRNQIGTLRRTMIQLGYNENAVDDLLGKYRKIPEKVSTTITQPGMGGAQKQTDVYKSRQDKVHRQLNTKISVSGYDSAAGKLNRLSVYQQALKKGQILPGFQGPVRGPDGKYYAEGGYTGPGGKYDEAGIVHADEHVIRKSSRRRIEQQHPGMLDHINKFGELPPGYAEGGRVLVVPYPVTASKTRIPSRAEVARVVIPEGPAGPSGGSTRAWMERLLESRFGVNMISGYRPGSRTLSGNRSYHSLDRAVDFPPLRAMAAFMYANYKSRLKEAITPYQQYNVHNGRSHRYTGAVWRQHAFGYGNAHNHFAMANGGVIREPVVGVGSSGRTYSFGEYGPETVTPGVYQPQQVVAGAGGGGTKVFNFNIHPHAGHPVEQGRQILQYVQSALQAGSSLVVGGERKL